MSNSTSTSSHNRSESHQSAQPPTPSQSHHTTTLHGRDLDSAFLHDGDPDASEGHDEGEEGVHYVLLAEFDIDAGATLAHQYPYPTGTEEHRLAELMLPDGAHLRTEDWTVFYLGQTPSSAINPVFTHENQSNQIGIDDAKRQSVVSSVQSLSTSHNHRPVGGRKRGVAGGGLLYVLNCVRQKEDKKMRRGAMVKALAVCSPNPYIQIYKPLLLLAMEEYFISGSVDTLAKLYDCANAISTYGMPKFSRMEKILLRQTEQKDLLAERYLEAMDPAHELQEESEQLDDVQSSEGHNESVRSKRASYQSSLPRKSSVDSSQAHASPSTKTARRKRGVPRDTHVFETEAQFAQVTVPIRIPMTVFDEDVGDYSLIEFFRAFSQDPSPFAPPFIPYLHTNGAYTHPIILILNAMLAHKRIVFLGNQMPANTVARMVLAACALATGSGHVLSGVTESAFPYANLASLDILEQFTGYVAGVCNPRFADLTSTYDVLCDVETGKVTVSKDIRITGAFKSGRSSESSLHNSFVKVDDNLDTIPSGSKIASSARSDCIDNQFIDDVLVAVNGHYGELHVRQRVCEYMTRFSRLAAHHEYSREGTTNIGYPSKGYQPGKLGSGITWPDATTKTKELQANAHRIEAWRRTRAYRLCQKAWKRSCMETNFDFDLNHQISRLRLGKNMPDTEAQEIFSAIARSVNTYEQVIELLTHLPVYLGGLIPIANGLLHRYPGVREAAADILLSLQHFPVGRQAVANMNYFHRKTFLHLLERREKQEEMDKDYTERLRVEEYREDERYGYSPSTFQANQGYSHSSVGA